MNSNQIITVIIADDHNLFRQGIKSIIDECIDMQVIGETNNGEELIVMMKKLKPDVVLMDNRLSDCPDYECAKRIACAGQAKVIILSKLINKNYALRLFKLGASGYLFKDCAPDEVTAAVRTVHSGKVYLNKKAIGNIPENLSFKRSKEERNQLNQLTAKESEVLSHIASGYSTKEIAAFFCIETGTIMTYKKRIREKLNLSNDVELTKFAIRNGLACLN